MGNTRTESILLFTCDCALLHRKTWEFSSNEIYCFDIILCCYSGFNL